MARKRHCTESNAKVLRQAESGIAIAKLARISARRCTESVA
jgi:hypothetical protein